MVDGTVSKTVLNKAIPKKIEWDFNVPDSKRDILKILSQQLTGAVTDYEIKDNLFLAHINLCANMTYLPEGGGEPPISAVQSCEQISVKTELPQDIAYDFSEVDLNVSSLQPVLINSRKAGVRGNLTLNLRLVENFSVPSPDFDADTVQILSETMQTYATPVMREERVPFSLHIPLPAGKPPIHEILETNVFIRNQELKAISNKAVAKGELEVKILYASTLSTIEIAEFSSPFTEILDIANLQEDYQLAYTMKPQEVTAEVMANDENETKNLSFSGDIAIFITATQKHSVSLITDAYSPGFVTRLVTKSAIFEDCDWLPEAGTSVKEILSLGDRPLEEMIDVSCYPKLLNAKTDGGRVLISGALEMKLFYKNSGGIQCALREIPFEFSQDVPTQKEYTDACVKVELNHFSYNIMNHNSLEIRAGLFFHTRLCAEMEKEYVEAIFPDPEAPILCDRSPIVAYIIKPGDTLFQIAKKYGTTAEHLKELNQITNERNLKIGSYLIIE